jgi:hypothetical protein
MYSFFIHSRGYAIFSDPFSILYNKRGKRLMNQNQRDTLFLECLLGVNASTCFGRYSPIFRRLCADAIWCNYVLRTWTRNLHAVNTHPTHVIIPNSICAEPAEDGWVTPKHVEALTPNKHSKKSVSHLCLFIYAPWHTVNKTSTLRERIFPFIQPQHSVNGISAVFWVINWWQVPNFCNVGWWPREPTILKLSQHIADCRLHLTEPVRKPLWYSQLTYVENES